MAASNEVLVARALLAHETNLNQVKQCVEVDFLLHDEGLSGAYSTPQMRVRAAG